MIVAAVQVVRRLQRRRADVDHHRLAVRDQRRRGRADRGPSPRSARPRSPRTAARRRRSPPRRAPARACPRAPASRRSRRTVISDTPKPCARSVTWVDPDAHRPQDLLAALGRDLVPWDRRGHRSGRYSPAQRDVERLHLAVRRLERDQRRAVAPPASRAPPASSGIDTCRLPGRQRRPSREPGDAAAHVGRPRRDRRRRSSRTASARSPAAGRRRASSSSSRPGWSPSRPTTGRRAPCPGPVGGQVELDARRASARARRPRCGRSPAPAARPEIGTPLRADCAIVCGDSAPLRFGFETFGGAGVGRPVRRRRVARQRRVAPAVRVGLDAAERRPRRAACSWSMWRSVVVPGRRGVVVVVRRDVQPDAVRVDGGRQVGQRDLHLEVVAAARVGVVGRGLVAADPRARSTRPARRARSARRRRCRQRAGRVALVVVGVALPARAVGAVAVGARRVVGEREDAELERVRGVLVRLRRVAARVDQDLDRVRLPVTRRTPPASPRSTGSRRGRGRRSTGRRRTRSPSRTCSSPGRRACRRAAVDAEQARTRALPAPADVERSARCTRRRPPCRRPPARPRPAGSRSSARSQRRASRCSMPAGASVVVVIGTFCVCVAGSVASCGVGQLEVTVASAPGASGPYGLDAASAVKFGRQVELHRRRSAAASDQLCTTTGTVIVSPTPIDWTAARAAEPVGLRRGVVRATGRTPPSCPSAGSGPRRRHDAHDVVGVAGRRAGGERRPRSS